MRIYSATLAHVRDTRASNITFITTIILIYIIVQPKYPMVGRRPHHYVSISAYLALSSAIWYPSSNHLIRFSIVSPYSDDVPCRLLTCSITSVTFAFSLTHMYVYPSRKEMFNILLSIFIWALSLFFAWLVSECPCFSALVVCTSYSHASSSMFQCYYWRRRGAWRMLSNLPWFSDESPCLSYLSLLVLCYYFTLDTDVN